MYRCATMSHPNMCVSTIDVVDNTGKHVQMSYDVTSILKMESNIDTIMLELSIDNRIFTFAGEL